MLKALRFIICPLLSSNIYVYTQNPSLLYLSPAFLPFLLSSPPYTSARAPAADHSLRFPSSPSA